MLSKLTVKAQTQWNEEELDYLVQLGNALEEGYVFDCWTEAGETVSTDPELQDEYGSSRVLTAHFRKK